MTGNIFYKFLKELTEEKPVFICYFMTRHFPKAILQNTVSALGIFMAVAAAVSTSPALAQDSTCPKAKDVYNSLKANPENEAVAWEAMAVWQKCDPNTDEGRARDAALAIWANNPEALTIILQGGDTSSDIKSDILTFAINKDMPKIVDFVLTSPNPPKGDALTPALIAAFSTGKTDMADKIMQIDTGIKAKALIKAAGFKEEGLFIEILNSGVTEAERDAALIPAIEGPSAKTLAALLKAGVSVKARQNAVAYYQNTEIHAGPNALPHLITVMQTLIPQLTPPSP